MRCRICDGDVVDNICTNEYCGEEYFKCQLCGNVEAFCEAYEYKGAYSCFDCFDDLIEKRDRQRNEIIEARDTVDKIQEPLAYALTGLMRFPDDKIAKASLRMYGNLKSMSKETLREKEYNDGEV